MIFIFVLLFLGFSGAFSMILIGFSRVCFIPCFWGGRRVGDIGVANDRTFYLRICCCRCFSSIFCMSGFPSWFVGFPSAWIRPVCFGRGVL